MIIKLHALILVVEFVKRVSFYRQNVSMFCLSTEEQILHKWQWPPFLLQMEFAESLDAI